MRGGAGGLTVPSELDSVSSSGALLGWVAAGLPLTVIEKGRLTGG